MINVKRFFRLDDGCVSYLLVARDLDHAKQLLRESNCMFGPGELPLDAAATLTWSEMDAAQVVQKQRCHTEDARGCIPLAEADVGDWFCSEW